MLDTAKHSSSNLRSLGATEAKLVLELASTGVSALSLDVAARILGSRQQARDAVRRLLVKGWLQRASGGHYVLLPPEWGSRKVEDFDLFVLASASIDNGYVGWWAAASRHGFTTQVPNVTHVATDRQVPSREIQGNPVRYVKLSPRKFWGWQDMASSTRTFRVSTREKTVIDCVDRPGLCGGPTELAGIVARAAADLPAASVVAAAIRFGSVSVCQRLGYLLDLTAPGYLSDPFRKQLRDFIPGSARSVFGSATTRDSDVGYVSGWGLYVNAVDSDLLSEVFPHSTEARS